MANYVMKIILGSKWNDHHCGTSSVSWLIKLHIHYAIFGARVCLLVIIWSCSFPGSFFRSWTRFFTKNKDRLSCYHLHVTLCSNLNGNPYERAYTYVATQKTWRSD